MFLLMARVDQSRWKCYPVIEKNMLRGYMYLSEKIYSCTVFSNDFKQRNIALYLSGARRD